MTQETSDVVSSAIYGSTIVVVIVTVVGALLYGCDAERGRYYRAQQACIAAGGTWVPAYNGDAACIRHQKEERP